MAPGEPALDAPLTREQPIHRRVQRVLVGIAQVELFGQRRGMPQPGGGELRGRMEQTFHDHRHDPVALGGALRGDEPVEPQAPDQGQEQLDVAVGRRAFDGEGRFGGDQTLALEHSAQGIDLLRGPVGEVGQGLLAHSRALAPAFSQQDRGAGVAVGDGFDIHGNEDIPSSSQCQAPYRHLHGNNIQRLPYRFLFTNQTITLNSTHQIPGNFGIKALGACPGRQ